jgi:hypothetical protein
MAETPPDEWFLQWPCYLPRVPPSFGALGPGGKVIGGAGLRQAGYPPGEAEVSGH